MRTRGQSKISSSCICVWFCFEAGELGGKRSSRFPRATPALEIFSSDRVAFRTQSNINNGAPLRKQSTALRCRLFLRKCSTTDFQSDSKCRSDCRCFECGLCVDCTCIEFVAAGFCIRKWLRFDQTIRNLTPGDLGILLVVIRLGVTILKNTRVVHVLDFLREESGIGSAISCMWIAFR